MKSAAARNGALATDDHSLSSVRVAVSVSDHSSSRKARALARNLGLPLVPIGEAAAYNYLLVWATDRLELRDNHTRRPLYVDLAWLSAQRGRRAISRRQPLARAMGARTQNIVDATAGFGDDAFLLTAMGYRVIAVERSAVVAALLHDGVRRASKDKVLHEMLDRRLRIVTGDARDVLPRLRPRPDTIYVDPMFPPKRRRSALAHKAVRVLRDLVGHDDDAPELLRVCLRRARRRVVVKRPHYAPPLAFDPSASYTGKLVRYDVYIVKD